MSTPTQPLTDTFIEEKRIELTQLRNALKDTAAVAENEEKVVKETRASATLQSGDDAQDLDVLEKDGLLVNRSVERLTRVERALLKIAEGTYGLSDVSGKPIPIERLRAVPEAVNTVSEQEASEKTQ